MSNLKLEQISTFISVVRLGGIKKAAESLNITQPAVTSRIKSLEETLGVEVFERTGSGVRLTKRGDLLVGYAEQFLQLAELVKENVMDPAGVDGHLRLGSSETITQSWLPVFISEFHALYPKIKMEINVDISANLRERLLSREIDLAFLLGPISEYTVNNVELPVFDLAWYRSSQTPISGTTDVQLSQTPIITYARNTRPFRELRIELFKRFGPHVPLFPSSSLSSCFRLVEAGVGVAALPRTLGEDYVEQGRIQEFDPGWYPNPLKFSASYLGEPKSHVIETAAKLAFTVASQSV